MKTVRYPPPPFPPDIEAGLSRHGYLRTNWRYTDDDAPILYYQFWRTDALAARTIWRPGTPYEWTISEAAAWLATFDADQPHRQEKFL